VEYGPHDVAQIIGIEVVLRYKQAAVVPHQL
jgi:hypothetical protein